MSGCQKEESKNTLEKQKKIKNTKKKIHLGNKEIKTHIDKRNKSYQQKDTLKKQI